MDELIPVDDFFVDEAKGDPELLHEILLEAIDQLDEGDYKTCCGMLRTYILASNKTADVADFLNCSEEDLVKQLNNRAIEQKAHLEKVIEFLQLKL
ncbi:MAG: hypothetical protein EA357_07525 [Micavibrio sp.]|nr:MAG: hypothetical protein EA357_07525 [Micavibrio sp.]